MIFSLLYLKPDCFLCKLYFEGKVFCVLSTYLWPGGDEGERSAEIDNLIDIFMSRASLVAQLVKNPPAMQETLVRFLGWEDLLEKG